MEPEFPTCDDRPVWDLWLSVYRLPAVTVADELHLFDAIAARPGDAAELAQQTGCSERGLAILLPFLAALGFLVQRDGCFHVSDTTRQFLLHDSPFYWGALLARVGAKLPQHKSLINLLKGAGSEGSAYSGERRPVEAWESGQLKPEMARGIATFMHSHSLPASLGLARNADFSGVRRLLDVGGGSGCFSISLARRYPDLHCTVMDLPAMCEVAQEYIAAAKMEARVDTRAADMFRDDWPHGYDAVFFSNVFHDWSFETCAELAARTHGILPKGGRICLHEMLLNDDGAGPLAAAAFSVAMLHGTQGQQFTFAQLRELLEGAGFTEVSALSTYGYYSLVSGIRP
ncbi:MAG: methyltransferase [Gammaproteobacteria bacterium]|jgi:hypothetical protein